MIWIGGDASAMAREERSDNRSTAEATVVRRGSPDPEMVAKPAGRQSTVECVLRILEETDRYSKPGDIDRILRRERLYNSRLMTRRKKGHDGTILGFAPKKRSRKLARRSLLKKGVHRLKVELARLKKELTTAKTILEV